MVEVVYRQENVDKSYQDAGFKLPKNIRQIGGGESDVQVYMEDNVALYLSKVPDREEDIRYGVLLGNVKRSCGYTYIFINGAVDVREIFDNTVLFSDDIWTALNDDISRFFAGSRVVGWFLSQLCSNSSQNVWIKKMHLSNFAGMDKVFMKIDREEDEEAFYYYGKEQLEKLPCYHIYYEKNRQMVQYMIDTNADIHFRNTSYDSGREGVIRRAAQKKADEIKSSEAGGTGNAHRQGRKNVVADSNDVQNAEEEKTEPKVMSYNRVLGKAASFLVIGALAATVGVMGVNGQFDNLAGEFKALVSGIVNGGDEPSGGKGVISVNGVPEQVKPQKQTDGGADKVTDDTTAEENTETEDDTTAEAGTTKASEETTTAAQEETTTAGENGTAAQGEDSTASVTPASTRDYMVQKGDTLYSICRKLYGSMQNMDTIIELNNLESADDIYYGKNLIVP